MYRWGSACRTGGYDCSLAQAVDGRRFEDYDPSGADERSPETFAALRRAVLDRAKAEAALEQAITVARQEGSWRAIGSLIGNSGEAARQRYSRKQEGTNPPMHRPG